VAKHADEWNAPAASPADFRELSKLLDEHCAAVGRDPAEIRRSVQLFLFPGNDAQIEGLPDEIAGLEEAGVHHVVLSFYAPPTRDVLERLAPS
jgi:hypothetical protein